MITCLNSLPSSSSEKVLEFKCEKAKRMGRCLSRLSNSELFVGGVMRDSFGAALLLQQRVSQPKIPRSSRPLHKSIRQSSQPRLFFHNQVNLFRIVSILSKRNEQVFENTLSRGKPRLDQEMRGWHPLTGGGALKVMHNHLVSNRAGHPSRKKTRSSARRSMTLKIWGC